MKKIAIIIPYFGVLPFWNELFFNSCVHNSTIDFFFFTDCEIPDTYKNAGNIHVTQTTFGDYCNMVGENLNISFHPVNPYKLCDLKPFYGILHQDILAGFDFWGFGDMDLVWGDIRKFYTDDILSRYDVISNHADRISGHLALIRNNIKCTNAAYKIQKWQSLLEDKNHHALDEMQFTLCFYPQAKWLWKIRKHVFFRLNLADEWASYSRFLIKTNILLGTKRLRLYLVEQYTTPWFTDEMVKNNEVRKSYKWMYDHGKVYDERCDKELVYLHFLSLKKYWGADCYKVNDNMYFTVSLDGFNDK